MPSSMIHLLAAYKLIQKPSVLFCTGNVVPDAVPGWKEKDITHFRDLEDRSEALAKLARQIEPDDEFSEGVLLHLFLDWKWDDRMLEPFKKSAGEDWFVKYRNEISLAGSYIFHHVSWGKEIWDNMNEIKILPEYGTIVSASIEQIKGFISRNHRWNKENDLGPSGAFPPAAIYEFIGQAVEEYAVWRTC